MLLTITSTTTPATDLGFLLHKNPSRAQTFKLGFGRAYVFYPGATPERCTAALPLDVDPVGLVRARGSCPGPGADQGGAQYVSDRPYVASSFLSVAIGEVFGTALAGRSRERAELAQTPLPLEAQLSVVPTRGGEGMVVKPLEPIVKGRRGLAQPALKVRGAEYLRIIHGPEYLEPANLDRLRVRGVGSTSAWPACWRSRASRSTLGCWERALTPSPSPCVRERGWG